ncbi:MAG TPA: alpha/beta hydrolase, partial [Gemmatimonadaceae bacterium]|nr:alpha/beta hydrolase [Gemmatimonadaceae bacterium]
GIRMNIPSDVAASREDLYFTEMGSGQPLLLVHGLMVTGHMFAKVAEPFAKRHRVIMPDLRGHGRSRTLPPPHTVAQLAADLARLLDRLGIESTAVLGYSQGGAVAQQFAIDYPERCTRLVLGCTYAYNMSSPRERLEGRVVPYLLRLLGMQRFAKLIFAVGFKNAPNIPRDWLVELMANQDQATMMTAWKEAMAFDSRPRLAQIKCPTLIIAAANDEAVPFHHAKMLHEGVAESQLVVVPNASHALIWTHPEALVRQTEDFLAAASH